MNYAEAAEVIKATVGMRETASMLGYEVNRSGFMVCPFHGDTDASLKIYPGRNGHSGWHCFGCGRGGSVIDFVMESEHCNFSKAVRILNDGMGLQLLTVEDMFAQNTRQQEQRTLDEVRKGFDDYILQAEDYIDRMLYADTKWLLEIEGKPVQERTADEWIRQQLLLEEMQYYDYLLERLDELRREVSKWRNKARSGRSP